MRAGRAGIAADLCRMRGGAIDEWVRALEGIGLPPHLEFVQLSRAERALYQRFIREFPAQESRGSRAQETPLASSLEGWAWGCLRAYVERFEPWRIVDLERAAMVASDHRRWLLEPCDVEKSVELLPLPDTEEIRSLVQHGMSHGLPDCDDGVHVSAMRCWLFLNALTRCHSLSEAFIALAPFHRGEARPARMVARVATPHIGSTGAWLLPETLARRSRVEGVDYWTLCEVTASSGVPEPLSIPEAEPAPQTPNAELSAMSGVLSLLPPLPRDGIPLALAPVTIEGLSHLRVRWAHRERVINAEPGLFALMSGPRGMGRATAARELVEQLGLPLLRLDAGAVASPWLGETEKRITSVFEAARHAGAALLIEDADDLFAPRTEVARSADRYANMSTNHLLQQVDSFRGLCILTANGTRGFDAAMRRRIAVVVSFPDPAEELRARVLEHAVAWLEPKVPKSVWPTSFDLRYIARVADGMSPGQLVRLVIEVGLKLTCERRKNEGADEVDPFLAAVISHQRRAGVVSGDLIDDSAMRRD
jgi:hypothetical protein